MSSNKLKFVVAGGAGNVSKPLTEILLQKGHDVTVLSRNPDNIAELAKAGATPGIGDLHDIAFLTQVFSGADAVYLLIPPSWTVESIKQESIDLAKGFVEAIKASGVKHVVYLSSYGAHRLDDAGAISGMGLGEVELNKLSGVNVLHLRAGYFYTNLLLSLDLINKQGIMGNMFTIPDGDFTVVAPEEIAEVAAEAMISRSFQGHSFEYVVSDETGTDEIASLIGKELGIQDLKWVKFPAEDLRNVLLNYGFSQGAAADYVEMFGTLDTGLLFEDYLNYRKPLGKYSIENFAKKFADIYRAKFAN